MKPAFCKDCAYYDWGMGWCSLTGDIESPLSGACEEAAEIEVEDE
jgi:hypothetical protein